MATGHDIAMGLRAAYWTMHRQAMRYLARQGVTPDQLVLLALLAEEDGVTQQELVRRASSDPNTVRAMLVLLESRGLVRRKPHPTDGRARSVEITPAGRRASEELRAATRPLQDALLALFEPDEADRFVSDLERLAKVMAEHEVRLRGEPAHSQP